MGSKFSVSGLGGVVETMWQGAGDCIVPVEHFCFVATFQEWGTLMFFMNKARTHSADSSSSLAFVSVLHSLALHL